MNAFWKNLLLKLSAMNENALEKMLSELAPHPASARLESLVERDLMIDSGLRVIDGGMEPRAAKPKPKMPWWQPVVWASLGAAAAVAVTSLAPQGEDAGGAGLAAAKPPAATARGQASNANALPVNSTRQWVDADDQGVQFNSQHLPERRVRVVSMERHEWVDPRDGAQIAVEIPREDTVVLPVEFQ